MINNDTPAFPSKWVGYYGKGTTSGMSLRDWFAGQAMAGIMAGRPNNIEVPASQVADTAYELADAMLEVRKL